MAAALHTAELGEIAPDETEILRYAMLPRSAQDGADLPLDACLAEIRGRIRCRAVWREFPLIRTEEGLDLGFAVTRSKDLGRRLSGCEAVLLFCCTAGTEMDRLITRATLRSPVHGLLMHAIGAQQVEGACDALCAQLAALFPEYTLSPRYSPGYGDLPLALQRDVFAALDCERLIGVTLTDSLLMRPSKSVTAIIGMKKNNAPDTVSKRSILLYRRRSLCV